MMLTLVSMSLNLSLEADLAETLDDMAPVTLARTENTSLRVWGSAGAHLKRKSQIPLCDWIPG